MTEGIAARVLGRPKLWMVAGIGALVQFVLLGIGLSIGDGDAIVPMLFAAACVAVVTAFIVGTLRGVLSVAVVFVLATIAIEPLAARSCPLRLDAVPATMPPGVAAITPPSAPLATLLGEDESACPFDDVPTRWETVGWLLILGLFPLAVTGGAGLLSDLVRGVRWFSRRTRPELAAIEDVEEGSTRRRGRAAGPGPRTPG